MIDTERAGAIGYSFDGYNTLAMSGARIDPSYYLRQCPDPDPITAKILTGLSAFDCGPAANWDSFIVEIPGRITTSEDGLWLPMSDRRVLAVMPMAPEGWWLFGERGLAAIDRPMLMIAATEDSLYQEDVLIFEHVGVAEKTLISFIGEDHMMVFNAKIRERMAHFAVAFFGYYLQWGARIWPGISRRTSSPNTMTYLGAYLPTDNPIEL